MGCEKVRGELVPMPDGRNTGAIGIKRSIAASAAGEEYLLTYLLMHTKYAHK